MKKVHLSIALAAALLALLCVRGADQPKTEPARFGIDKRIAWTTSRIRGTPEPPPPFKIVRAFPKLTFTNPLHLTTAPGSNRFFVCEQATCVTP